MRNVILLAVLVAACGGGGGEAAQLAIPLGAPFSGEKLIAAPLGLAVLR